MENIFKNKHFKLKDNNQVMIWNTNRLIFLQYFEQIGKHLDRIELIDNKKYSGIWEYVTKTTSDIKYCENNKGLRKYKLYIFKHNNILYELSKVHIPFFFQNFEEINLTDHI